MKGKALRCLLPSKESFQLDFAEMNNERLACFPGQVVPLPVPAWRSAPLVQSPIPPLLSQSASQDFHAVSLCRDKYPSRKPL